MARSTRWFAALALLGLAPVAVYFVGLADPIVALSVLNVLLIAASLYWMFGPAAGAPEAAPTP